MDETMAAPPVGGKSGRASPACEVKPPAAASQRRRHEGRLLASSLDGSKRAHRVGDNASVRIVRELFNKWHA